MFLPRENAPAFFAFRGYGARSDARASPTLRPSSTFSPAFSSRTDWILPRAPSRRRQTRSRGRFAFRSVTMEAEQILGKAAIFTRHSRPEYSFITDHDSHTRSRYIRCASSGNEPTDIARRSSVLPRSSAPFARALFIYSG